MRDARLHQRDNRERARPRDRRPRRCRSRRSRPGGPASGISPRLIRWALMTMRLSAAWRNTSVSRTTGTAAESITSASTCPGPDRWQLIDVAHQQQRGVRRHGAQQRGHQRHVDHRGLVDHDQVAVEGLALVAPEPPVASGSLPAADGWSWPRARSPPTAARRAAGRRAQRRPDPLGHQDLQDGVEQRGLADARAAGHDQHLRDEGQPQRRLPGSAPAPSPGVRPPTATPCRRRWPAMAAARRQPQQRVGDVSFGGVQAGEKDARRLADAVAHDLLVGNLELERLDRPAPSTTSSSRAASG